MGLDRILIGFDWVILELKRFYWVLPGFYCNRLGCTRCCWVFFAFYWNSKQFSGLSGFYWVLLGFTEIERFYWVLPGLTGIHEALQDVAGFLYWNSKWFIGLYWVLLDFTGFYWVLLGYNSIRTILVS